ncbi:AMP-binding protein [Leucobacter weissii]|uniref:AMP-binding protein n=1 Tax=Leucobacter weissii TaxID=1983706 RepID=UPI003132D3E1
MNTTSLRTIPTDDRAWLLAGLADALDGGAPILPVGSGTAPSYVQHLQQRPLPDGTAVLVRTSGSSGVPKTVALSAEALRVSARAAHEALGGDGQWLLNLPAHLISGLQILVRSVVLGQEPVFVDGPFDPARLLDAADRMSHERRYVSLVPVQLSRLLELAEADAGAAETLRGFAGVLVGGQSTPLGLRQRAHELGVPLRRSYGMTETAGGCVYDGVEIGDTRVRIRDGEVQVSGSCLALGYIRDPELTGDRFIEEDGTRWYRTGDAGRLLGGVLEVTGRLDRVIVSGGVNVSLDEIERRLEGVPGWTGAVVLGLPDDEWGERPVLVRELADAAGGRSFDEVRAELRAALGAAAVPERVIEVDEMPRLAGGKPDLRRLRAEHRPAPGGDPAADPRSIAAARDGDPS